MDQYKLPYEHDLFSTAVDLRISFELSIVGMQPGDHVFHTLLSQEISFPLLVSATLSQQFMVQSSSMYIIELK